jgi:hypothetical protein
VKDFHTIKEAKDFLANRIAAEAARENVPLSEVERKMLYFSETDWTLPEMAQVSAEFDRDYDQDDYEQKIAGLVANIAANRHHNNEDEARKWEAAVGKLSEGDHYLTVLIAEADRAARRPATIHFGGFLPTLDDPGVRPPHDRLKLWTTAFVAVFAVFFLIILTALLSGR